MELLFVTGMSGAGKTYALKTLEDIGYYCVDNMPVSLIHQFVDLLENSCEHTHVAVGIDIRSGDGFPQLGQVFEELGEKGTTYVTLYLDASDEVLIKRFKETRRSHPLARGGQIRESLEKERSALQWLRHVSSYVIDTSMLLPKDLKLQIENIFSKNKQFKNLFVTIMSFGYKYGLPSDSDMVFDVRFLPNPYYVDDLRNKSGLDEQVRNYVLQDNDGKTFLEKVYDMLDFLIPRFIEEGKSQLIIGFGCTGGKHRSVTVAEEVFHHFEKIADYGINIIHRDIENTRS